MIRHTTGGCKHHYKHHKHGSSDLIIIFYVRDLLDLGCALEKHLIIAVCLMVICQLSMS